MATEQRLIDADEFLKWVVKRFKCVPLVGSCDNDSESMKLLLAQAPTVDAVEVVRCKDCKHRGEEGCCPMYFVDEIEWDDDGYIEVDYVPHDYTVDDGFCDRGERRTNERKAD